MSTDALSHRDGILAKLRGRPAACIPFATYNLHPFGPHGKNASYAGLLEVVQAKAGMIAKHEPRRVGGSGSRESFSERSPSETRHTTLWHTPRGDLRAVTVVPTGQPGYVVEHFVKDDEDIERVLSAPAAEYDYDLTETRRLLEAMGDRGVLYTSFAEPMYTAASLFDFEEFVIRCHTDADRMDALIAFLGEQICAQVERLAAACEGLPIVFYTAGPEVATPPMLPPAVFARFVTPHVKRLVAILHRHGHVAGIHCHGRVRLVLDEVLETGADFLEPIEPPNQGDIGLAELLERVGDRMCLMGHIQDQEFYLGQPGHMRRRVEEIAALVPPTARYIMTPTCTPFQYPVAPHYAAAYREWIEAAAELLPR